jgi:cystathionine beta-lyase/cystathionine gamma-synthase
MSEKIDDLCPRPDELPQPIGRSLAPAIYPASVYRCDDPDQARAVLAGDVPGFVYQRDGHPNGQMLAEKCRLLHDGDWAMIASSGMAAMSLALLSHAGQGDHLVVSNQLYGRSLDLLVSETGHLGIDSTVVDTCDLPAVAAALKPETKLLVVETIANPLLRVADIAALAELAHNSGAKLLVDNTFASPAVCQPMSCGADLVLESLSKIMNGHSDVMLGLLVGKGSDFARVKAVSSIWGLASSPMDCWLAHRGLTTLALRADRASSNALAAAEHLAGHPSVARVRYPGLSTHEDHATAAKQFSGRYGSIVTFDIIGGQSAATKFIQAADKIPFCPSLGEVSTTLSHPASTSHRALSPAEQESLGITGGTLRLSVGTASPEAVIAAIDEAFS